MSHTGENGGFEMEGTAERPLLAEDRKKGPRTKIVVIIVVVVLVLTGILSAVLLSSGQKSTNLEITTSSTVITAGENVSFDASNSTDKNGAISKYSWNFGDEKSAEGVKVNHTFVYPGLYSVLLTITGPKGDTTGWYEAVTITVANLDEPDEITNSTIPYAFMASDAFIITSGTGVTFNASESHAFGVTSDNGGNWTGISGPEFISELTWDFGDGSSPQKGVYSASAVMEHAFEGDGRSFPVSVNITSVNGTSQKYYQDILIFPKDLPAQTVKNPDTFVVAQPGEPTSLDPAYVTDTYGGEIIQNVYETLIFYDGESTTDLVPVLAKEVPTKENGLVSSDGLNYTFNLKSGIMFHDGNMLTAKDVQYSFERLLALNDPSGAASIVGTNLIANYSSYSTVPISEIDKAVEIVDDDTVVFHLVREFTPFIYQLTHISCSIVSHEYVEAHGGIVEGERNSWMNDHEAGTGPYMLTAWVPGQYILMQRSNTYHEDLASIKYVMIKRVDDINVREMMLLSGDADNIYVPREHKQDVANKAGIRVVEGILSYNLEFIGFNQNINISDPVNAGMDIPSDFFADEDVRMAFTYAFDYDTFINESMQGTAIEPNGVIPTNMLGHNDSTEAYEYDLTLAAAYLENTSNPSHPGQSWADTGFTINLYYNVGHAGRESAAKVLAKGLTALHDEGLIDGTITVNVIGTDLYTVFVKSVPVVILGWQPDYPDPHNFVQTLLHEDGLLAAKCGIDDDNLTAMINAAEIEGNATLREQMYNDLVSYAQDQYYYIWTYQPASFHVEREWVNGYYYSPMLSGLYYYALSKG
jgi:peptide/nickel transport system substrate-binding protein